MRSPITDVPVGIAAGAASVEHQLPRLVRLDEHRVVRVADVRERVRRRHHRRVDAHRDVVLVELGDREKLHDVAKARGVGDVPRREPRDALAVDVGVGDPRVERDRGQDRALGRGVEPLDVGGGVGLGVAEPLGLGERLLEPRTVLGHLREDEVRRAVHHAEDARHAVARERLAQRADQRDPARDGGLVGEVCGARVRGGLERGTGGGDQLLVPGHHGLAGREGALDELARGLEPAEELEDHIDVGVVHDRDGVGGEHLGGQRDVTGPGEVADGHPRDLDAHARAARDVIAIGGQGPRHGRSDRAASQHPDADHAFRHVRAPPSAMGTLPASHGDPSMTSSRSMSSLVSRRIHSVADPAADADHGRAPEAVVRRRQRVGVRARRRHHQEVPPREIRRELDVVGHDVPRLAVAPDDGDTLDRPGGRPRPRRPRGARRTARGAGCPTCRRRPRRGCGRPPASSRGRGRG